ncbi:MAG TPA: PorV/PorQ family protein [Gemmatimonadaceae bacterium]|nr:PorV/PorQ family protein [Gemmatimonadaceae bacterium]
MRLTLRYILAAAVCLAPRAAAAQATGTIIQPGKNESVSRVATRGAAFLSLGIGARALALAGAATVISNDLSAAYWNAGGLADITVASAMASHEKFYGNSGLSNTAVVAALPALGGVFGLSFISFTSGDMVRTTEYYPDGGDPALGANVRWNATSVGVHYARPFTDRLAVGGTLKRATEGIEFASATYYGADVGVRFRTGLAGSTLGFSVANLGSSARMDGPAVQRRVQQCTTPNFPTCRTLDITLRADRLQLPTSLRFGVQTEIIGGAEALLAQARGSRHSLMLLTDVTDAIDTRIMPALAAEYGFAHRLFFRGGGRWLNDSRLDQGSGISYTAGGGVAVPLGTRRITVDYAWRNFGALNDNHVFSFQFGN